MAKILMIGFHKSWHNHSWTSSGQVRERPLQTIVQDGANKQPIPPGPSKKRSHLWQLFVGVNAESADICFRFLKPEQGEKRYHRGCCYGSTSSSKQGQAKSPSHACYVPWPPPHARDTTLARVPKVQAPLRSHRPYYRHPSGSRFFIARLSMHC
ncbi:hypothetical protein CIHG_04976 [Coccidioides immitis H538.4]|uniref:Uncharacterized protein n=2 Tax=Coccidioides immitis TaxID=5501 RepID=A0A0J8TJU9_COCIT|nr:hypothetical protein CISG_10270 [Coccidioides immitis RMSCC 3703]KMU87036.1 hypothetical protein CIHG_04976 [Coccidioides immitis H538.4]